MTKAATMSLLLQCLGPSPVEDLENLEIAALGALADLASREGLGGLLLRSLRGTGAPIPPFLAARLKRQSMQTAQSNLRRWHNLAATLEVLEKEGVPVIALKGLHLAECYYGSTALRPMVDADLLVPHARFRDADAAMLAAGFKASPHNGAYYQRTHFHFGYVDAEGFLTELHWHLVPPERAERIDLEALWERAEQVRIAGHSVRVLANQDLLVHLATHLAQHKLVVGLRGIFDVAEVVCRQGHSMDWREVGERAIHWRAWRATLLALHLARELLHIQLPKAALEAFPSGSCDGQRLRTATSVLLGANDCPAELRSWRFTELCGAEDHSRRLNALRQALFPSRDMVERVYGLPPGSWRVHPFRLRRWAYLLRRYGSVTVPRRARDMRRAARDMTEVLDWLDDETTGR